MLNSFNAKYESNMIQIKTGEARKYEPNKDNPVHWAGMTNGFHFNEMWIKFGNEL
jgi:hypothetical protein